MGTIVVASTNDSGIRSLRDASADSTKVTLKNLIVANGTGESQDGSTESAGLDILTGEGYFDGNDSSESGVGNDILIGRYSEIRHISEILTLPPIHPRPNPSPAFTDAIDGEISFLLNGFPGLSAIQRSQEAVSEFSGVSSVETTLLLPAVQSAREAASLSGGSSVEATFTSISVNNTSRVIL